MVGGSGFWAGLSYLTDLTMSVAVAEGYATVTTNGGVPNAPTPYTGPELWALLSPGNLNANVLQNYAYVSLKDAALAAKSVITSFFGRPAEFSYFDGCSQGGRQGLVFAQRYPDIFDGISANAPANAGFTASHFPQQVMNELGRYPHPCEVDTLTRLAIEACDGLDGVRDGIISDQDACTFNPFTAVGKPVNCSSSSAPKTISETAAIVADASWNGARRANGDLLWPTMGHQANLTKVESIARTVCSDNGTCTGVQQTLLTTTIKAFIMKDLTFDVRTLSRRQFEQIFRAGSVEFDSSLGTKSPDLYEFNEAGGKLLTWHGIVCEPLRYCLRLLTIDQADETITFRNSRLYYDSVKAITPKVKDFYRLFEAPGVSHCQGGVGGVPTKSFDALVNWVEKGIAPDTLEALDSRNRTSLLCPYPQKAVFIGDGPQYSASDFVCE